jgi:AmpE protein
MTLIILLMVLMVERVGLQSSTWQISSYIDSYVNRHAHRVKSKDSLSLFVFVAAPAVIIGIIIYLLDSRLIEFLVGLFVLAVSIGYYPTRSLYRQYLNAQQRGDTEAAEIIHFKLQGEPANTDDLVSLEMDAEGEKPTTELNQPTIGETLIWINLQYYAAPIFYYVLFGIPGVLFYSTVLFLVNRGVNETLKEKEQETSLIAWHEWLMWMPSRFVSLGYMFVGHFGNGLDAWLRQAGNLANSSFKVVTQVALAAEGIAADKQSNNAEPMVRLAKRNMVLFIVVVALLTLFGGIR